MYIVAPRFVRQMLDSDGIIGMKLCLMMEVLAVPSVMSAFAQPIIKSHGQFFLLPIHVDSIRFFDHLYPELIESPRISVKDPTFINATR